jgi:hypothetical protein
MRPASRTGCSDQRRPNMASGGERGEEPRVRQEPTPERARASRVMCVMGSCRVVSCRVVSCRRTHLVKRLTVASACSLLPARSWYLVLTVLRYLRTQSRGSGEIKTKQNKITKNKNGEKQNKPVGQVQLAGDLHLSGGLGVATGVLHAATDVKTKMSASMVFRGTLLWVPCRCGPWRRRG